MRDIKQESFGRQYARALKRYAAIAAIAVVVWLVGLPVASAVLGAAGAFLSAGGPNDPNWEVPIDLPNADGGCADPDATAYDTPLGGGRVYQTGKGC